MYTPLPSEGFPSRAPSQTVLCGWWREMLQYVSYLIGFIAVESTLGAILQHHFEHASRLPGCWIELFLEAKNIVRIEVDRFAHGSW
jgi:hypothetical protein